MTEQAFSALPPPGPPPFLSEDDLLHLAQQGWLEITLPETLAVAISTLLTHSVLFFKQPANVKRDLYPPSQGTEFGYYAVKNEKEYVTFRRHVHHPSTSESSDHALDLELSTAKTWQEAGAVLHRILCDIARASELDPKVWNDILDGTLEMPQSEKEMTHTLMRVFRYLPTTGHASEHTDVGLLTMCVGDREGLQVLDRISALNGQPIWVDAPAGTNKAIILVGQTLKMLSNESLNAGVHRVVGSAGGRSSIVYALRHSPKHDIDLSLFGGEGSIHPDELYKTMGVGKVNINTVKDRRDRQRQTLEAGNDTRTAHGQG